MKKLIGMGLVVVLAITFFAFGCARKPGEIKIGVVLPLSGPAAGQGEDIMGGINLALQELNNSGGIRGAKINLTDNSKIGISAQDYLSS